MHRPQPQPPQPNVQQPSRQNMQQGPHPNAPISQTALAKVKPQGQQNFMYGRVNHMTRDEAQQAQDVVLGMFLISLHPATILFDSGASHSFISSSFVAKHSLPIATMNHTMLVSSLGVEMRTKRRNH
jgi:hypothetical protein